MCSSTPAMQASTDVARDDGRDSDPVARDGSPFYSWARGFGTPAVDGLTAANRRFHREANKLR